MKAAIELGASLDEAQKKNKEREGVLKEAKEALDAAQYDIEALETRVSSLEKAHERVILTLTLTLTLTLIGRHTRVKWTQRMSCRV